MISRFIAQFAIFSVFGTIGMILGAAVGATVAFFLYANTGDITSIGNSITYGTVLGALATGTISLRAFSWNRVERIASARLR